MEYLNSLIQIPLLQILGFLIVVALAQKLGFPVVDIFKWIFTKNGNGKNEHRIEDLESHAKIANHEVGKIKDDISEIKSDMSYIRGKIDSIISNK